MALSLPFPSLMLKLPDVGARNNDFFPSESQNLYYLSWHNKIPYFSLYKRPVGGQKMYVGLGLRTNWLATPLQNILAIEFSTGCSISPLRSLMRNNKKIVSLSSIFFYLQRIQEIVRYHNPEQPLFLYMAFQNVHNPIQAPEEYVEKYDFIDQRMRRVHAGMVDILDEAVGNITKAFKDKG